MSRPAGEPAVLAAAARGMGAAAEALGGTRDGLRGAAAFVVVAGAWRGPASQAFLLDGAGSRAGLERAADALGQAAGALAELAARLANAQATWDRAQRLAATVGFQLDPHADGPAQPTGGAAVGTFPPGRRVAPTGAVDLAVVAVTAQAGRLAEAAAHEADAARRVAAARLDQAAATARSIRAGSPDGGPDRADHGHDRRGHDPGAGGHRGHDPGAGDRHGGPLRRAVAWVLEAGAEAATTTHHLVAAAEARVHAAARLATTADDPAVRAAAGRVVETAGRPLLDGRALGALPLVAPVLDFAAAASHGESLPRAAAGAIGGAIGADVGGRVGLAACGGQAAATQGAGIVVCPALTAVGGALGSRAGKGAALHLYDSIAGPPGPPRAAGPRQDAGLSGWRWSGEWAAGAKVEQAWLPAIMWGQGP
jgi:hypothetical protein